MAIVWCTLCSFFFFFFCNPCSMDDPVTISGIVEWINTLGTRYTVLIKILVFIKCLVNVENLVNWKIKVKIHFFTIYSWLLIIFWWILFWILYACTCVNLYFLTSLNLYTHTHTRAHISLSVLLPLAFILWGFPLKII